MNDTEMRIAIAKAHGFDFCRSENSGGLEVWHDPDGEVVYDLLDYLNDLNACHEMEKVFIYTNGYPEQYGCVLSQVCLQGATHLSEQTARFKILHATPRQRCEAFLRTIGKWKD